MKENYKLKVNDQYEFTFTPHDLATLDMLATGNQTFHFIDNHKSYHVGIPYKSFENKTYIVEVNSTPFAVKILDPLDLLIDEMGFASGSILLVGRVDAPMPGLILEVSVQVGQEVNEGEPLLILEAMKMENVITSPRAGTIKSIEIKKGDAVEKKQLLITYE